jgi:hypothetical protein
MGSNCKIIPVKNRLGHLLHKPGGIARDEAVAAAGSNVETLRGKFVKAIPREIAALEAILNVAGRERISKDELDIMLRRAGELLTLSGTFGFARLDLVVKRFCDLALGMIDKDLDMVAPVSVHLRAMRLVCPGSTGISDVEADHMLKSLEGVHAHLGITSGEGKTESAKA